MNKTCYFFWKGRNFTLMEYYALASTAKNCSFDALELYYDEHDHPRPGLFARQRAYYWDRLDEIPGLRKIPVGEILGRYLNTYISATARQSQLLADLFRYCHLYENGGFWFDLDTFQLKDLVPLAEEHKMLFAYESSENIAIGVLYFEPGSEILLEILRRTAARLQTDKRRKFGVVGPKLFTEVLTDLDMAGAALSPEYFYPVHFHRPEAAVFDTFTLPANCYSLHLWGNFNRKHFLGKRLSDFDNVQSTYLDLVRAL